MLLGFPNFFFLKTKEYIYLRQGAGFLCRRTSSLHVFSPPVIEISFLFLGVVSLPLPFYFKDDNGSVKEPQ